MRNISTHGIQAPIMYIVGSETTRNFVTKAVIVAVKLAYGSVKFLVFDTTKMALKGVKQILALSAIEETTNIYNSLQDKKIGYFSSSPFVNKSIGFGSKIHLNHEDEMLLSKNSVNMSEFGKVAQSMSSMKVEEVKKADENDEESFLKWYKSLNQEKEEVSSVESV